MKTQMAKLDLVAYAVVLLGILVAAGLSKVFGW